jgi:hypothetical protein
MLTGSKIKYQKGYNPCLRHYEKTLKLYLPKTQPPKVWRRLSAAIQGYMPYGFIAWLTGSGATDFGFPPGSSPISLGS